MPKNKRRTFNLLAFFKPNSIAASLLLFAGITALTPPEAEAQYENRRKRQKTVRRPGSSARPNGAKTGPKQKNNPNDNVEVSYANPTAPNAVSGVITDKVTGEPIPSAVVTLIDPKTGLPIKGVFADGDGKFLLPLPPKTTPTLRVQYVGMKTVELPLRAEGATINIALEEDIIGLETVVVTALNLKEKKTELGYSTQEVKPQEIVRSGETNVVNALAAKVAGVQVISTSGMPGASTMILIRGVQSITGNNQPLFVVDGVPFDNSTFTPANGNPLQGVALSNRAIDLNPDDIESMNVLKGPAAAALYGTRAGTGAIVITTKRGGYGRGISASFRTSVEFSQVNRVIETQKTYAQGSNGQYLPTTQEKFGSSFSWGPRIDTLNGVGAYNNIDNLFRTGTAFNQTITFTKSTDEAVFHLSLGRFDQFGVLPETGFNRTSVRSTYQTKLGKKTTLSLSANFIQSGGKRAQQGSNLSGIMLGALRTPPSFDNAAGYEYADGSQRSYSGAFDNPFWSLNKNPFEDRQNRIFSSNTFEYEPFHWLKFTARVGLDFFANRQKQIFALGGRSFQGTGLLYENQYNRLEIYSDVFATVRKKLGENWDFSLTAGNNLNDRDLQQLYAQSTDLAVDNYYNIANGANITAAEARTRVRIAALFAFAKIRYKDLVILNFTARNEFASTFGPKRPSFFYPSVNAGFIVSELPAFKDSKLSEVLSFAKVRCAFSVVGQEPPPYNTRTYFNNAGSGDGYVAVGFPYGTTPGFTYGDVKGNDDLKPETVTGFEIGADLRFWNNRLALDVTYYAQTTTQAIFTVPMPPASGFNFKINNDGRMTNRGLEIILSAIPIMRPKFQWTIDANFSHNKNKVERLAAGIQNLNLGGFIGAAGIYVIEGMPYGVVYGTKWLRNPQGQVLIDEKGYPRVDVRPGVLGNVLPDFLIGFRNTFTINQKFNISILTDIRKGGDIFNGTMGALTYYGVSTLTEERGKSVVFDGVVEQKDGAGQTVYVKNTQPAVLNQEWFNGRGGGFTGSQEAFVQDGSWIRLRELSLSYRFDKLKSKHIDNIDVGFTGKNLLLFAPNFKGNDPETNLSGAGTNSMGIEYFNFPQTRAFLFTAGITVK